MNINWDDCQFRSFDEWKELSENLDLDNYTTEDIDFTGCDPVIAEAIKQNKSILCNASDGSKNWITKVHIVNYIKESKHPYVSITLEPYKHVEPIKKKSEVQIRVKGPVEVIQWLVENNYRSNKLGVFGKKDSSREFDFRAFSACGKKKPEWWDFPELLEAVKI